MEKATQTTRFESLSQRDLAAAVGVSPRTIQRWKEESDFPGSENGRYSLPLVVGWLVERAEIKARPMTKEGEEADHWLREFRKERALTARYQREVLEGKLLYSQDVESEIFKLTRMTRDALLNIPARLAAILAAESDRKRVEEMLDIEMRKALEELPNVTAKG